MTEQDRPAPDSMSGGAPAAPEHVPTASAAADRDAWLAPAASAPTSPAPGAAQPGAQLVPAYAPAAGAGAGAPPYGPPAAGGAVYAQPVYAVAPPTNGLAITSLVCGLAGLLWVTSFIASPLAIIFGFMGLSKIKRTGEGGKGMAIAGIIIGFALIVPAVIAVVFAVGWLFVVLGFAGAGAVAPR